MYGTPSTYDIGMSGSTNLSDVFEDEARGIVNPYSLATTGTTTDDGGTTSTVDRTNFL